MSDMTVQGQTAGSVNEYNVAQALNRLKLDYLYQYPIFGGRVRGGQVIDFLVQKPPKPIPVFIQGAYWHSGARGTEDVLKFEEINQRMGGQWERVVTIEEQECETVEQAYNAVLEKIGR